jgi:hypothetical protein
MKKSCFLVLIQKIRVTVICVLISGLFDVDAVVVMMMLLLAKMGKGENRKIMWSLEFFNSTFFSRFWI